MSSRDFRRFLACIIVSALVSVCLPVLVAHAIKHAPDPDPRAELERVQKQLDLRNGELLVVRGQLRACLKRRGE